MLENQLMKEKCELIVLILKKRYENFRRNKKLLYEKIMIKINKPFKGTLTRPITPLIESV